MHGRSRGGDQQCPSSLQRRDVKLIELADLPYRKLEGMNAPRLAERCFEAAEVSTGETGKHRRDLGAKKVGRRAALVVPKNVMQLPWYLVERDRNDEIGWGR